MYSIVLTNGKIINVKATEVEWCEKSRTIRLINGRNIVARFNMDNIVGWIAGWIPELYTAESDRR